MQSGPTRTFSKLTSQVEDALIPSFSSFFPMVIPSASASTMNAVIPASHDANQRQDMAIGAGSPVSEMQSGGGKRRLWTLVFLVEIDVCKDEKEPGLL